MELATKTMQAIETAIQADGGAQYRMNLKKYLPLIEDAYRGQEKPFRKRLGGSKIGHDCTRYLWYSFRWVKITKHTGRILRLFNRGHLEEGRMIAALMLLPPPFQAWFDNGQDGGQITFSDHNGHFGSAVDGVLKGVPDLPLDAPCLLEAKTFNKKTFTKLEKEGVESAQNTHFVQMQLYMEKLNLPYGLHMATCKDDDTLRIEIIQLQPAYGKKYTERAESVIYARSAPARLSNSKSWWQCRFCEMKGICHENAITESNCRTCQFSSPMKEGDGAWACHKHQKVLTFDDQLNGCDYFRLAEIISEA